MKQKILALVLALCMLMPLVALGETTNASMAADSAVEMEIGFIPGTLPDDLASFQTVFTDALNALGMKLMVQKEENGAYEKFTLLLGGQEAITMDAVVADKQVGIASSLLGEHKVTISIDQIVKMLREQAANSDEQEAKALNQMADMLDNVYGQIGKPFEMPSAADLFGGDSTAIMVKMMDVLAFTAEYIQDKTTVTEGNFEKEGVDPGVSSTKVELSKADVLAIWNKIGEIISTNESLKNALMSTADSDQTFEDVWTKPFKNVPETAQFHLELITDASGGVVSALFTVLEAEKVLSEFNVTRKTETAETNYTFVLRSTKEDEKDAETVCSGNVNIASNGDVVVEVLADDKMTRVTVKMDPNAEKVSFRVEAYEMSDSVGQFLTPELDMGLEIEVASTQEVQKVTLTIMFANKPLVGMALSAKEVEKQSIPDMTGAVDILNLTEEEMQAFVAQIEGTVMQNLGALVQMLPQSLLALMGGGM